MRALVVAVVLAFLAGACAAPQSTDGASEPVVRVVTGTSATAEALPPPSFLELDPDQITTDPIASPRRVDTTPRFVIPMPIQIDIFLPYEVTYGTNTGDDVWEVRSVPRSFSVPVDVSADEVLMTRLHETVGWWLNGPDPYHERGFARGAHTAIGSKRCAPYFTAEIVDGAALIMLCQEFQVGGFDTPNTPERQAVSMESLHRTVLAIDGIDTVSVMDADGDRCHHYPEDDALGCLPEAIRTQRAETAALAVAE